MKKIITTVGTSIFINYNSINDNDSVFKSHYEKLKDRPFGDSSILNERIEKVRTIIIDWAKNNFDASAEISSILKIQKELNGEDLDVYLLSTDTILSPLAAEIIKDFFENRSGITVYFNPQNDVIKDLQVKNFNKFEKGKHNLVKRISILMDEFVKDENEVKKKKFFKKNVIFNITGGYKGIIPLITILAQLYGCEIKYKFEESNDMISTPRLPINFDPILTESLYIDLWFKKESSNYDEIINRNKLQEYGFINKDGNITPLGDIFCKMVHYNQAIGDNVFGYFVEYKILEYLCIQGKQFQHSFKENNKRELDFVFEINDKKKEVWEIKPAMGLIHYGEKIKSQIKKQIEDYSDICKHTLILYSIDERVKDLIKDRARDLLKELESKFSNVSFEAKFLFLSGMRSIKKQEKKSNPYQILFDRALNEKEFIKF